MCQGLNIVARYRLHPSTRLNHVLFGRNGGRDFCSGSRFHQDALGSCRCGDLRLGLFRIEHNFGYVRISLMSLL